MDANKKRDIAKDLADFLINETKQKDSAGTGFTPAPDGEVSSGSAPVYELPDLQELSLGSKSSVAKADGTEPISAKPLQQIQLVKSGQTQSQVVSQPQPLQPVQQALQTQTQQQSQATGAIKPGLAKSPSPGALGAERTTQIFDEVAKIVGNAEAIRVAQVRILELEKERDELRNEVSKLLLTSEALQKSFLETKTKLESTERKQKERVEILEEEKLVVQERLKAREVSLEEVKAKNEELELRFKEELKKIRVREREYENINLILKAESSAVSKSKDEMILDLKRRTEQLQFEIDNFRSQISKNHATMEEWRERQTRTVKALRLALSIMEGASEVQPVLLKKVAGDE